MVPCLVTLRCLYSSAQPLELGHLGLILNIIDSLFMAPQGLLLPQLLKDCSVLQFFEEYYLKLPFAQARGGQGAIPEIDRTGLLEMLRQPELDFIAGKSGQHWTGPIPKSDTELDILLTEGFTVGIRHAERCHVTLRRLADCFQQELAAPVNIHVYCTPANTPGFGWHYDAEEVFIFQTAGEKDWLLRKNTVNPWPMIETIPKNQRYERELMPVLKCRLSIGDWLYIPSGYWHKTEARGESISLSVGIESVSAIKVIDFLRPRLIQSILRRQRLPCVGSAVETNEQQLKRAFSQTLADLGAELTSTLNSPELIQSLIDFLRFPPDSTTESLSK